MIPPIDFSSKTVLITGSTRGIGYAIAEAFSEAGASIVINGRKSENVSKAVSLIKSKKGIALGVPADISIAEEAERLVAETLRSFGRLDVLVNNAGLISKKSSIEELTEEEWDLIFAVNLKGMFLCSRAAAPWLTQVCGNVINISSKAAVVGSLFGGLAYTASKGGVLAFTRALAHELGPRGVRVNAIVPGLIRSEMTKTVLNNPDSYDTALENLVVRRVGLPEEVASAAIFLASPLASFMSGQAIHVDSAFSI